MTDGANDTTDLPLDLQPASFDIWDQKYRLKDFNDAPVDQTIGDTWRRVADALAEIEPKRRQHWRQEFLWALENGAIPAGRIIANAGALSHKPATSTINCTVSGTIGDSMHDILQKNLEAGLTLKAGCGIGYEFSTLRPRGAFVAGAGANTSGPLSFMDIFDRMCFTISSAGGRRGAQMATFDVHHPDASEFIRAKREAGRLRQFNLSLLITDDFIQAVKADASWPFSFPVTESDQQREDLDANNPEQIVWRRLDHLEGHYWRNADGEVACKVFKRIPARQLWNQIMRSTYDFAEPGFILIDRVNQWNNNWFCEDIRATNPCVTGDTWVHTTQGPRQVTDLIGQAFVARVDGREFDSGADGFFITGEKPVFEIQTAEGHRLKLTSDHKVRRLAPASGWSSAVEWIPAGSLQPGDQIVINNHRRSPVWHGAGGTQDAGYLMGVQLASVVGQSVGDSGDSIRIKTHACGTQVSRGTEITESRHTTGGAPVHQRASAMVHERACETELFAACVQGLISEQEEPAYENLLSGLEQQSSKFYQGFLRSLFDLKGAVKGATETGIYISLAPCEKICSHIVQRMLLRLGIHAVRPVASAAEPQSDLNDSNPECLSDDITTPEVLVINGDNLHQFATLVGFSDSATQSVLKQALASAKSGGRRERFVATVTALEPVGRETVYDVQIPGINAFDANGFYVHNCGEQPLPPYGSCLLGSVNLTRFVKHPFTENAEFDWEKFRKLVAVFTRMLDNVVEINGLALPEQREEIQRKRRHGMGFLGLGSTLSLLTIPYGSPASIAFTEQVSKELALAGWREGLALAREKGPAAIMDEVFEITPTLLAKQPALKDEYSLGDKVAGKVLLAKYSRYMRQLAEEDPELVEALAEHGARFTHHSSIAPTGTISLSLANNASNGIEPSFAHHYARNVIRSGRKSKEKVDVFSYELLSYRQLVQPNAKPFPQVGEIGLPDYFVVSDQITPEAHVDVQAAAQKWVDSSISKTINVPTEIAFEHFRDIYLYAFEKGLKGCTTFRFNPEAFQGVLVKETDLENTTYVFELEDGRKIELKGNEKVEYDGERHTAANLYDAIKEGYYGKF